MLYINHKIRLPESSYTLQGVRSSGPGGQHVNKVATAVVLHFDIPASPLPEAVKQRILRSSDQRIREDGVLVLKAQEFRTRERNRQAALDRLQALIRQHLRPKKSRKPTKRTRSSQVKRLRNKREHSEKKQRRGRVDGRE